MQELFKMEFNSTTDFLSVLSPFVYYHILFTRAQIVNSIKLIMFGGVSVHEQYDDITADLIFGLSAVQFANRKIMYVTSMTSTVRNYSTQIPHHKCLRRLRNCKAMI
jgi:hypothetical protein